MQSEESYQRSHCSQGYLHAYTFKSKSSSFTTQVRRMKPVVSAVLVDPDLLLIKEDCNVTLPDPVWGLEVCPQGEKPPSLQPRCSTGLGSSEPRAYLLEKNYKPYVPQEICHYARPAKVTCQFCGRRFKAVRGVAGHIRQEHRILCHPCKQVFYSVVLQIMHIKEVH